jgi:hypothetical protein
MKQERRYGYVDTHLKGNRLSNTLPQSLRGFHYEVSGRLK